MTQPIPRFIAPTVLVLAVLAVAFAGLGGMVIGDKIYPLFGAGVLFCLGMILVFHIVLGGWFRQRRCMASQRVKARSWEPVAACSSYPARVC